MNSSCQLSSQYAHAYEERAKSFEPEHIRLQFFSQSIYQLNVTYQSNWLLWACCRYGVIV